MNKPKIVFRPMTKNENIDIIKWSFFEDNGSLDVKKYTLEYFPKLKEIDNNLSKEEIYQKIGEIVTNDYKTYFEKIEKEVKRYNSIWEKYNDKYMETVSDYLNVSWPEQIKKINVNVGLIPVFPRYLDTFSFSLGTNIDNDKLIETCAHETLHFIWFEKWKNLYPECPRREYDSPFIPWQYSEMVTDPILNNKKLNEVLKINAKAYESFYSLKYNDTNVMEHLKDIYNTSDSIEEKIINGYEFIEEVFKSNKKTKYK